MSRRIQALLLVLTIVGSVSTIARAGDFSPAATQPVLPPSIPWDGASRALAVTDLHDPWITACEASNFRLSPSYDDTVAWLKKLVAAAPDKLAMVSLGQSLDGREIWMVIASNDRAFDAKSLKASGKPTYLAQAGIHSGEIDGKDAGMMLLRDMTVRGTKSELLTKANFLFIPILSVDAHERSGRYTRSNQRGPEIAGWRTTPRNINLNRDYGKLEAPETRAVVRAIDEYDPDLYFDLHVTDGADYQYDITFGGNGPHAHSPAIGAWLRDHLGPRIAKDLSANGHTPGRLVFEKDPTKFDAGMREMTAGARYSHGYGDARHVPSMLVENHALKPYDRRVLGTYVLLESALRELGDHPKAAREAIERDRAHRADPIALDYTDADGPAEMIDFLGIDYRIVPSMISGGTRVEWLGKPRTMRMPYIHTSKSTITVSRPKAYWIPRAWTSRLLQKLTDHGIRFETIDRPREMDVKMYRLVDPKLAAEPFEGFVPIKTMTATVESRRETFLAGSIRISTDQPLGELTAILLEPSSPESFLQWGYFSEILQRTEYIDAYILEPMADRMLAEDPKLREEFTQKLNDDPDFATSPAKRRDWFYSRTPFTDERWQLYPIAREE